MTVSYRGYRKWLKCFAALNMSYCCTPASTVIAARQTQVRHGIAFITPMASLGPCFHHDRLIPWLSHVAEMFCNAQRLVNMSYYCTPAEYSGCCTPNPDTT